MEDIEAESSDHNQPRKGMTGCQFFFLIAFVGFLAMFGAIWFSGNSSSSRPSYSPPKARICGNPVMLQSVYDERKGQDGQAFLRLEKQEREMMSLLLIRQYSSSVTESELCDFSMIDTLSCMDTLAEFGPSDKVSRLARECGDVIRLDIDN